MLPLILPLGDRGLLVRFGEALSDEANRAAIALAGHIEAAAIPDVLEGGPNLISVLVRYEPARLTFERLAGEIRLLASAGDDRQSAGAEHRVAVRFDGEDLESVAGLLGLSVGDFLRAHNVAPLRVLATGFAPGFIYCGLHPETHMGHLFEAKTAVVTGAASGIGLATSKALLAEGAGSCLSIATRAPCAIWPPNSVPTAFFRSRICSIRQAVRAWCPRSLPRLARSISCTAMPAPISAAICPRRHLKPSTACSISTSMR